MVKKNTEVEVFEVWLDDEKIDELIGKLKELKDSREHIHLDDKKKNHILFVHKDTKIL